MSEVLFGNESKKGLMQYERIVIALSILLLGLGVGFLYWQLFPDIQNEAFVPLHYNVLSGIDTYGPWWRLFTLPVFGLVFFVINVVVAHVWLRTNKLLHAFLYSITLITQFVLFIALVAIVLFLSNYYG